MPQSPRLVALGYGKYVRADRIYGLIPLEGRARGSGRRTLVHVEGLPEPLIASRSEQAILLDIEASAGAGAARRVHVPDGQESLFE